MSNDVETIRHALRTLDFAGPITATSALDALTRLERIKKAALHVNATSSEDESGLLRALMQLDTALNADDS